MKGKFQLGWAQPPPPHIGACWAAPFAAKNRLTWFLLCCISVLWCTLFLSSNVLDISPWFTLCTTSVSDDQCSLLTHFSGSTMNSEHFFSVQLMFTCRVETQTIKMNRIHYIEELTTASIIIILEFSSTARWNVLMIFIFFLRLLDCTFWIISQWPSERGHLHRN